MVKRYKKLVASIFTIMIMAAPLSASAATLDELQVQIAGLLKIVAQLQQQLTDVRGGNTPTPTVKQCENFTRNLYLGKKDSTSGGEVSKLQRFLKRTGNYTYGEITGYYGPSTIRAVQGWQRANGVVSSGTPDSTGYGVVGPSTRKAMRCGTVNDKNITKATYGFIAKGFMPTTNIFVETDHLIDGRKGFYVDNPEIIFSQLGVTQTCFNNLANGSGGGGMYGSITFEYSNVRLGKAETDQPSSLHITKIIDSNGYAASLRNCSVNNQNKPPTIHSFTGPTTLKAGEKGTWSVSASDKENGRLSYSIQWGDEQVYASAQEKSVNKSSSFTQNTSFQHTYAHTGTYRVRITVRDEAGNKVETTSTVRVVIDGIINIPVVEVISPNGGEVLKIGDRINIKWRLENQPEDSAVVFYIDGPTGKYRFAKRSHRSREFDWIVGDRVCDGNGCNVQIPIGGNYKIRAVMYEPANACIDFCGDNNVKPTFIATDSSDTDFKLIKSDDVPSIKVTVPNGGEVWTIGEKINSITWSPYSYHPTKINPPTEVTAYLEQKVGNSYKNLGKAIEYGKASIHWRGAVGDWRNLASEGSNYYIRVKNSKTGEEDRSDRPFTLKWSPTKITHLNVNGGVKYDSSRRVYIAFVVPQRVRDYSIALYKNDKWFKWIKQNVSLTRRNGSVLEGQNISFKLSDIITKDEASVGGGDFKVYVTARLKDGGYVDKKSTNFGLDVVSDNAEITITKTKQPRNSLAPQRAKNVKFTKFRASTASQGKYSPWIKRVRVKVTPAKYAKAFKKIGIITDKGMRHPIYNRLDNDGTTWIRLYDAGSVRKGNERNFNIVAIMESDLSDFTGGIVGIDIIELDASHTWGGGQNTLVNAKLPLVGATHTINSTLVLCNSNGTVNTQFGYEADCDDLDNDYQSISLDKLFVINGEFARNAKYGDNASWVMDVKKFFGIHAPDDGSISKFDNTLRKYVMAFQYKYKDEILAPLGLSEPNGIWDTATRAKANQVLIALKNQSNSITISPAAQPGNSLAPQRAKNMPFTNFKIKAHGGDVSLTGIKVELSGLVTRGAIRRVLARSDDGKILGSAVLGSNNQAIIPLHTTIAGHDDINIVIAADIAYNTATHTGEVAAINVIAINSDAGGITGSLPITGARHTINASLNLCTDDAYERFGYEADCSGVIPKGTSRGYMNGQLFITTNNVLKSYAVDICKKNHKSNPTKRLRCTWNNVEVYNEGPAIISVEPSIKTSFINGVGQIGQPVKVIFSGIKSSTTNWIGIYKKGTIDKKYIDWKYLNNTKKKSDLIKESGTVVFSAPGVDGEYEARMFSNNGYTKMASTQFYHKGGVSGMPTAQLLRRGDMTVTLKTTPGITKIGLGVGMSKGSLAQAPWGDVMTYKGHTVSGGANTEYEFKFTVPKTTTGKLHMRLWALPTGKEDKNVNYLYKDYEYQLIPSWNEAEATQNTQFANALSGLASMLEAYKLRHR